MMEVVLDVVRIVFHVIILQSAINAFQGINFPQEYVTQLVSLIALNVIILSLALTAILDILLIVLGNARNVYKKAVRLVAL